MHSGFALSHRLSGSSDFGSEKTASSTSCPKLQRLDVAEAELEAEANRQRSSSFGGGSPMWSHLLQTDTCSGSPKSHSHSPASTSPCVKSEDPDTGRLAGTGVGWNASAEDQQQQNTFSLLLAHLQQLYASQQLASYLQAMAIAQPSLLALCPQLLAAVAASSSVPNATLSAAALAAASASASAPASSPTPATANDAALAGAAPLLLSRLMPKQTLPLAHGTWNSRMAIPSLLTQPAATSASLNAKPVSSPPSEADNASTCSARERERVAIAPGVYDAPSHLRCLSALQLSGTSVALEMTMPQTDEAAEAPSSAFASAGYGYARGKERERARSGPTGGAAAKGHDAEEEQPQIGFLKRISSPNAANAGQRQRPSPSASESSCKSDSSTPTPEKEKVEATPEEESNSYLYYKKKKRAAAAAAAYSSCSKAQSERSSSTVSVSPNAIVAASAVCALKCESEVERAKAAACAPSGGRREGERPGAALRPSVSTLLTPSNSVPSLSSSARSPAVTPPPSSEMLSLPHFFPNVPLPPRASPSATAAVAVAVAARGARSIEQISPTMSQSDQTPSEYKVWKPYSDNKP